ncbi:hypothetical protein PAPYR_1769 [Paratrimastix pyriformis]|uniref:Uncharacterized protein n=1 Tax=Paratrimastix pyriformis TaxID=342808 RepID=A0ABQ8UY41_9EUKA|nr:hypothetical protein PAPYR_1769 [Paratrimastix pyriformis]
MSEPKPREISTDYRGRRLSLTGSPPFVGSSAPHFVVESTEKQDVFPLGDLAGPDQMIVLVSLSSFENPYLSNRGLGLSFSSHLASKPDVLLLFISRDTPDYLDLRLHHDVPICCAARWAADRHLPSNVHLFSDKRQGSFGRGWNLTTKEEAGLLAHSAWVLSPEKTIVYIQIAPNLESWIVEGDLFEAINARRRDATHALESMERQQRMLVQSTSLLSTRQSQEVPRRFMMTTSERYEGPLLSPPASSGQPKPGADPERGAQMPPGAETGGVGRH